MQLVFIQDDIANWTARYLRNDIPLAHIREVKPNRFIVKHLQNDRPPEMHFSLDAAQVSLIEDY